MKEQDLLQALTCVDDAFLLEAETGSVSRRKRRTLLLLAAVLIVILAACSAVRHWDPVLLHRFHPSDAAIGQTAAGLQDINAVSRCGDVTLTVRQTLGDETILYAVLDVTLPDSMPLSELVQEDEPDLLPCDLSFYHTAADYADIQGLDYEQSAQFLHPREYSGVSIGIQSSGVDYETNTLTFLIQLSAHGQAITDSDLTLLIRGLAPCGDDSNMTAEGPYLISWSPQNAGPLCCLELTRNGRLWGTAQLSAFALHVELYESDYRTMDDFVRDVYLVRRNGRLQPVQGGGGGGSLDIPDGNIWYSWEFPTVLDLNTIRGIRIGDTEFPLEGTK